LTIDISPVNRAYPAHPRIAYLGGHSSLEEGVLKEVQNYIDHLGGPVIVILDSDHSRDHVLKELEAYHGFVTPGSYLIVEDTNVNNHPVLPEHGPGPYEACEEFFPKHPEFKADNRIPTYHLLSQHNWYRRMKT
jgi:cephalosporin hydroxylase